MTRGSRRTSSGRPLGDLLAVVEDGDPVADAHDELHVVLDEQDREPEVAAEPRDERRQVGRLPAGSCPRRARRAAAASGWRPGPGRSRAGAGRRRGGSSRARCRLPLRPTSVRSSVRAGSAACSSSRRPRRARARVEPGRLEPRVHPDEHVLDRGHVLEQADVLERPADARRDHVVGRALRKIPSRSSASWYQTGRTIASSSVDHERDRRSRWSPR